MRVPPLYLPGDYGSGLEDSEAVRLFIARARAVCPGFAPQEDELAATAEICAALDGLPLAIELAAARIRLYPPLALLPMLRSRLALLTGGPRDLPQRQQTLRATLDWSHDLLPAHARRLFAYLGVFAGSFDAAAASAVSGDPEPFTTLENLADLADQSLLEVTAGQPPSFRMLQTVREYSLARLAETGEQDAASQRHLAYFLNMALATHTGLDGPGQAGFFDQLEAAYPNLRAALEFADREAGHDSQCLADGLRLAAALGPLWQRRGPLAEGMLQLDRLRPATMLSSARAIRWSGPPPCWLRARWPALRATTPAPWTWPATASSSARPYPITAVWPWPTASSAKRPSQSATTMRPSRTWSVS